MEAAREIDRLRGEGQWLPMESAPKATLEQPILITTESGFTRVCWLGACGWTYHEKYGGAATVVLHPTHWMPLPAAPGATVPRPCTPTKSAP
jgi:hypothetical protein